jgi:hypothetical protein
MTLLDRPSNTVSDKVIRHRQGSQEGIHLFTVNDFLLTVFQETRDEASILRNKRDKGNLASADVRL